MVRSDDPLPLRAVRALYSGSDWFWSVFAGATPPLHGRERWSHAVPWVDHAGDVHFQILVNSGFSDAELGPLSWLERSFETTDLSDYTEDTGHGLGSDWRAFEASKEYSGAGTLTASVATDVHSAGTVERPYVGYGDFDRNIELSEIPALPADRDSQGVNVGGGVKGSIDGVPGEFTCDTGVSACGLEISRDADAEGYYPYGNVVFTRDDNGAREVLLDAAISQTVPLADYLIFGIWQYVPGRHNG